LLAIGEHIVSGWRRKGPSFHLLINVSFLVGAFASHAVLFVKQSKLETFISHMADQVHLSDARPLVRKLSVLLTFLLVQNAVYIVYQVLQVQKSESQRQLIDSVFAVSFGPTCFWIMSTCVFYWTILNIFLLFHERQLAMLCDPITGKLVDHAHVCNVVNLVMDSANTFDQLLSPLPFVWFAHGMVSSSGLIYGLIENPSDYINLFFTLHDYVPQILVAISAARIVGKVKEMAATAGRLVRSSKSISQVDKILLLYELDTLRALELTGMSYFSLDRSFVLSYVGSVMTFAALMAGFTKT